MAQVTINKSDNQILVSFPHGIDTFRVGVLQAGAGSTSKGVIIQDTSNSKKILREVPFDQIKQSDGTQFGSTVSATVTALNTLIYASPDILIKSTDKVTALNGVTASDFTGKSGFAVIVDGTDLNMATSGKLLFNNHNELKLGADLDLSIKKIYTTSTNGDIELDPNGTGDVILGNYTLDGDQTVGAGQDNYVLTYDHASATISLEEAGSGTTINNNADNRLITGSGTANTLNGESNLTYSTDLSITSGKILIATNDKFIEGALAGGASFPLIGVNTSDEVVVGNTTSRAVTLEGVATITRGVNNDSSALSSIGHYGSGADITFLGAAQTSVYQGRLYYWNGTTWTAYTLATEPPQGALLGVSIGTTMASGFVLRGMVYSGSSLSTGKPVYGDQGATPTTTPPTSGFQRIIGHSVSTNVYYFNPSQEYIEIAE
jgi:hypothetical protein